MEASVMTDDQLRSYGVLLLRLALGTMFIAHSVIYMLMTLTLAGTAEFFVSIGLPAWLAYATFFAEAVGGIFLILGIQARWVALALSPILIGATWAHSGNGWLFASTEGGWEYPLYLFVLCIAQAMLGDGAYALLPSRFAADGTNFRPSVKALKREPRGL
jgi:putative oxidoreductase